MRGLVYFCAMLLGCLLATDTCLHAQETENSLLTWSDEIPPLPDSIGLAGPFVGVHGDALIVAGGANFPRPVWDNEKVWHDEIHILRKKDGEYSWKQSGRLPRPLAYGAAVSTKAGVLCIGGNDNSSTFSEVFLLQADEETGEVNIVDYPALPDPCAFGAAALMGNAEDGVVDRKSVV